MMNDTQFARWESIRSRGLARFLTPIAVVFALLQAGGRLLLDHFGGRPVVWLDLIALAGFQGVAGLFLGYCLWWFKDRQWRKAKHERASVTDSQP